MTNWRIKVENPILPLALDLQHTVLVYLELLEIQLHQELHLKKNTDQCDWSVRNSEWLLLIITSLSLRNEANCQKLLHIPSQWPRNEARLLGNSESMLFWCQSNCSTTWDRHRSGNILPRFPSFASPLIIEPFVVLFVANFWFPVLVPSICNGLLLEMQQLPRNNANIFYAFLKLLGGSTSEYVSWSDALELPEINELLEYI